MVVIDSHCVWILLVVCLLLCAGCANTPQTRQAPPRSGAREGDEDVTAAAFGDIYDMSDGALPSGKDGRHDGSPCGDTWYTTWAGDDTAYLIHDDGAGFDNIGGLFARNRLCRLGGDPNVSTADFRGVNLNPGLLGNTLPGYVAEPEWRKWYSTSIHEQDGILYEIRHNRTKGDNHSPIVESTIIKSTDGGKNWIDCLGQTNAPLPTPDHAMFPNPPFSRMTFIQYGKGNRPVNADNADKYAYLTTSIRTITNTTRATPWTECWTQAGHTRRTTESPLCSTVPWTPALMFLASFPPRDDPLRQSRLKRLRPIATAWTTWSTTSQRADTWPRGNPCISRIARMRETITKARPGTSSTLPSTLGARGRKS
jgi:hypothetical protein